MRYILCGLTLAFLTSCSAVPTVKDFKESEFIGVKSGAVRLITLSDKGQLNDEALINGQLLSAMTANCASPTTLSESSGDGFSPSLIPLVGQLAKFTFDSVLISNKNKLDALKKASQKSYSGLTVVDPDFLQNATCLLLLRESEQEGEKFLGSAVLLKIKHYGDEAFTFSPIYVNAFNTVAITKNSKEESGEVKISIAVSLKSVGIKDNGLRELDTIGAGVVTIPKVTLGSTDNNACSDQCLYSDLIPYPNDGVYSSLSVSIVETGSVGINFDLRSAEIEALKAAFGPAIEEAIETKLED